MKTTKGQITLVTIPENISYILLPSVTQISIATDGTISAPIVTCRALKQEGSRMPVELGSLEGTIYYKSNLHDQYYEYVATGHDAGVAISDLWSCLTFTLVLAGESDYITRVDVPITRSGQVDTNFRVWVGTVADPNTLLLYPWYGELGESQDPFMHINDYYVSPDMTYYCFIYDGIQQQYTWDEVTDINLKRWLARANNSTTGFIVTYHQGTPINTDVADFFLSREYIIGDLWANAKYTTTSGGQTVMLYDDEPLICKLSKTNGFNINDWLPISAIKDKLRETGIDVDEHKVTITADETWAFNNNGLRTAIINMVDGHPKINTDLIEINGGLIVENLGDAQSELVDLLSDNDIKPVTVTHDNNNGTVTVTSGNQTLTTYTQSKINDAFIRFGVTRSDGESGSSFVVSNAGLLQADNAVIYGELHATNGEFFRELQSAGGAFKVDPLGNVTATSFNGLGIISSGTTTITSENFYKYFKQSDLDVLNGSDEDDVYNIPYNKRWVFDLKLILQNIYIESLPSEITYSNAYAGILNGVALVFPHWLYGSCCRRGGLTMPEMFQLNGKVFNVEINNSLAVSVCIFNTLDPQTLIALSTQNGGVDTFCSLLYVADTDGIYPKLITSIGTSVVWQDSEPAASQTNTYNTSGSGEALNQHHYYEISITPVSRLENTFCFRWMCSSNVNIENLGAITLNGGEYDQNDRPTGYRDVVLGNVEYGQIVGNTIVSGTDGEYQQGYFYILSQYLVVLNFKFDNIVKTIENNNNTYKIILSDN